MKKAFTIAIFSMYLIALESQSMQETSQKQQTQKIDMHGGKIIKQEGFSHKNPNQQKRISDMLKDKE